MTDFTNFNDRNRDQQDGTERGMWGERTYITGAGSHMSVRGTGTLDEEVAVLNIGYSFNLPYNSNAEVVMLSLGSDTNDKVALLTIPRDLQHPWAEGQGGMQHPTNPNRRIEFNADETWIKDGVYIIGHDRAVNVTVDGQNVTITAGGNSVINIAGNASISVAGSVDLQSVGTMKITSPSVEINGASLTHNGINIGDDHKHRDVETGSGISGEPV